MKNKSLFQFSIDDCLKMIPAAGWRMESLLRDESTDSYYWSSSPDYNLTSFCLYFGSNGPYMNHQRRKYGVCIRPVLSETEYIYHYVKKGETLAGIAVKYNAGIKDIVVFVSLRVGQKLKIPGQQ